MHPTIALSSKEAKYRGATLVACKATWIELVLQHMEIQIQKLVVLYCDNMNRIQLARISVFHAHTKHIDVQYHFIKRRHLRMA